MRLFIKKLITALFVLGCTNAYSQSSIPSYLPADGLVGWWPFTGNAVDSSGNGNNGIVTSATLTTDRFGNLGSAYAYNGTTSRIDVTDAASLRVAKLTMSAWVKSNITDWKQVIYKGTLNATNEAYSLNSGGGSVKINSNCVPGAGWNGIIYKEALPVGVWTHMAVTYDGATVKVYKNGVRDSSYTTSGNIDLCVGGNLRFGFNHTVYSPSILGDPFNGIIDDIGIWNRALSLNEIEGLYNATLTVSGNVGINNLSPKRNLHVNDVLRLEPRDTPPSSPGMGDIYFDKALHKLRVYDGTTWQNCW